MQEAHIYSIYDRKAAYYLPLFNQRGHADANRQFTELVINSDTPIAKYPADYDLVCLGSIDLETGRIDPIYPVETIINGLVALQNAQLERSRYAKVLKSEQVDIEELIAEQS